MGRKCQQIAWGTGIGNFPPMKTLSLIDVSAIDDGFWLLQETSQMMIYSTNFTISTVQIIERDEMTLHKGGQQPSVPKGTTVSSNPKNTGVSYTFYHMESVRDPSKRGLPQPPTIDMFDFFFSSLIVT
ncbi:unnamed protein product [Camellia sinensis]